MGSAEDEAFKGCRAHALGVVSGSQAWGADAELMQTRALTRVLRTATRENGLYQPERRVHLPY